MFYKKRHNIYKYLFSFFFFCLVLDPRRAIKTVAMNDKPSLYIGFFLISKAGQLVGN